MDLLQLDAASVDQALDWPSLIDAIEAAFRGGAAAPPRHHHTTPASAASGDPDGTLLLMPVWDDAIRVVKVVTATPGNSARGLPSIHGVVLVFDAATGAPRALLDGGALTARRTAAASALAARFLARPDAASLGVFGTGRLAPLLAEAHAAVRPIRRVAVWGRDPEKAAATAAHIAAKTGLPADAVDAPTAAGCDIVSAATLSTAPLIHGAWLRAGAHVDLVGAFKPTMRETDSQVFRRADIVAVDTFEGARQEGGDVVHALAEGALEAEDLGPDLAALCRGAAPARRPEAISVFKSVGAAIEDLAAAALCLKRASRES